MESSTLRRSNLSKEKIAVLEALSKYKQESNYDNSPEEYVRPSREKELDLLWQNFKINQKSVKSPSVYLAVGFVAGALFMLLLTNLVNTSKTQENSNTPKPKTAKEEVNLVPAGDTTAKTVENYTVQNGDTVEAILVRFYGSYDLQKLDRIKKANNLSDINKLQIGQKLLIPMN